MGNLRSEVQAGCRALRIHNYFSVGGELEEENEEDVKTKTIETSVIHNHWLSGHH